jgi:hypothetical protein
MKQYINSFLEVIVTLGVYAVTRLQSNLSRNLVGSWQVGSWRRRVIAKSMSFLLFVFFANVLFAQKSSLPLLSFARADSLNKPRVAAITGIAGGAYGGMVYFLTQLWYPNTARSSFHYFDDRKEWLQMDKVGHVFGGYFESNWLAHAYQWAGVPRNKARWVGVTYGMLLQGTLEVLDGHSAKWGFSKSDIVGNTLGCSIYLAQEFAWSEQKICMKVSNTPVNYSPSSVMTSDNKQYTTTLKARGNELYSSNYIQSFLKDYNAQTLWLSGNLHALLPEGNNVPEWLNLAVGYGAEHLYSGFDNGWEDEKTGAKFTYANNPHIPTRHRQYYLSFDIDLTRIKTKSPFLQTILGGFNILKIPSPTLEYNAGGANKGFKGYWMFF